MRGHLLGLCFAVLAAGCGESRGSDGVAGGGDTAVTCENVCGGLLDLAGVVGCPPESPGECVCIPECAVELGALVSCLREDPSQCYCESDDDLNCEPGYKPNEGLALCQTQFVAYRECEVAAQEGPVGSDSPLPGDGIPPSGVLCAVEGGSCASNDCCEGLYCVASQCRVTPGACAAAGESCASNDCCEGLYCVASQCQVTPGACEAAGESCASNDCCEGLSCGEGGVCRL